MALIECKNASFGYGTLTVLRNVNLTVSAGDYICLAGPNGAGKSTLLRGLLKLKEPRSGSVEFGDGLTSSRIGYLPQNTEIRENFPALVSEVVLSGGLGREGFGWFYSKSDKSLAANCLEKLGISDLAKQRYGELSGGQRRRVLIARALRAAAMMLVMDEPTAGLDAQSCAEFDELVTVLNRDGMTVITVSHDVNCRAHRELRIENGEVKIVHTH
jgi:zinc transport system ATP-binding protein